MKSRIYTLHSSYKHKISNEFNEFDYDTGFINEENRFAESILQVRDNINDNPNILKNIFIDIFENNKITPIGIGHSKSRGIAIRNFEPHHNGNLLKALNTLDISTDIIMDMVHSGFPLGVFVQYLADKNDMKAADEILKVRFKQHGMADLDAFLSKAYVGRAVEYGYALVNLFIPFSKISYINGVYSEKYIKLVARYMDMIIVYLSKRVDSNKAPSIVASFIDVCYGTVIGKYLKRDSLISRMKGDILNIKSPIFRYYFILAYRLSDPMVYYQQNIITANNRINFNSKKYMGDTFSYLFEIGCVPDISYETDFEKNLKLLNYTRDGFKNLLYTSGLLGSFMIHFILRCRYYCRDDKFLNILNLTNISDKDKLIFNREIINTLSRSSPKFINIYLGELEILKETLLIKNIDSKAVSELCFLFGGESSPLDTAKIGIARLNLS